VKRPLAVRKNQISDFGNRLTFIPSDESAEEGRFRSYPTLRR
jgi:hypothetical protein